MIVLFKLCALPLGVAATQPAQLQLRAARLHGGDVVSADVRRQIRVCNAYAYDAAIDIYRNGAESWTDGSPMIYKTCRDYKEFVKSGDRLDFKVGDAKIGTFSVSDIPSTNAAMLLVIHRHDPQSTAVAFESQVFEDWEHPQIAIFDAYKGAAHAYVQIKDDRPSEQHPRREDLRFDSVIAMNPGSYKVELVKQDGSVIATRPFAAAPNKTYVFMRTGVEAEQGPSFPEELIVFPEPEPPSFFHAGSKFGKHPAAWAMLLTGLVASWGW